VRLDVGLEETASADGDGAEEVFGGEPGWIGEERRIDLLKQEQMPERERAQSAPGDGVR